MRIFTKLPQKSVLKKSVFVYPTETCYGIGCDALNQNLVLKVYKIKGRDFNKPVSWIVSNIDMASKYVVFSGLALDLAKKFWPGPLTLVLPARDKILNRLKYISGSIALRVSSHPIALNLVKKIDSPIVSTSANLSGFSECYTLKDMRAQFKHQKIKPDFAIDGGKLNRVPPSTVVEVDGNRIKVLRKGNVVITDSFCKNVVIQ